MSRPIITQDAAPGAARDVTRDMSDTKWLTYDEAAVALRISPESVRRLAQRRKWSRRPGNDGKVRLGVPAERLEAVTLVAGDSASGATPDAARGVARDFGGDSAATPCWVLPPSSPFLTRHVERLQTELAAAKGERDVGARSRLAAAEAKVKDNLIAIADLTAKAGRVDVVEALLKVQQRRIEETKDSECQRIAELKAERDRWAGETRWAQPQAAASHKPVQAARLVAVSTTRLTALRLRCGMPDGAK